MGKFLHRYGSEHDFQEDYNGHGPMTAFTISNVNAMEYTACSESEGVEQNPFSGTRFVFDRLMKSVATTSCDGLVVEMNIMVFKNGNDEVLSLYFEGGGWSHDRGLVYYIQDLSSALQEGDYTLRITSPEYGDGAYIEPWVSYTTGKRKVIKGHFQGWGDVFDTYTEGEFELRETGSKDIDFNCGCE